MSVTHRTVQMSCKGKKKGIQECQEFNSGKCDFHDFSDRHQRRLLLLLLLLLSEAGNLLFSKASRACARARLRTTQFEASGNRSVILQCENEKKKKDAKKKKREGGKKRSTSPLKKKSSFQRFPIFS